MNKMELTKLAMLIAKNEDICRNRDEDSEEVCAARKEISEAVERVTNSPGFRFPDDFIALDEMVQMFMKGK